jgi:hypothetical protein
LATQLRASTSNSVFQTFFQILLKLLKISHALNSHFFHQNGSCYILSPNLTPKISTPFFFYFYFILSHSHAFFPSSLSSPSGLPPFLHPQAQDFIFHTWLALAEPSAPTASSATTVPACRASEERPTPESTARQRRPDRPRRRIYVESRARFLALRPSEIGRKSELLVVVGENPFFLAPRRRIRVSSSSSL